MITNSDNSSCQIRKSDLTVVLVTAIAIAVILSTQETRRWPFEDTTNYLSVARLILNGDGLSTDIIYYPEQASFRSIPAPQTIFPPGYSIAVAATARLFGLTVERSAEVLSLFSYVLCAPLLLYIGSLAGLRRWFSIGVVAVWLSTATGWVFTRCAASEMMFLLFTLLAVVCCGVEKKRRSWLLAAGIAAALAFSARYVGVFLAMALGLAAVKQHGTKIGKLLRCTIPLLGPMVVLMAILFARNHLLSGSWKGGNNYESQSFGDVLIVFYYSVCRLIGFSKAALLRGDWVPVGLVVSSTILTLLALKQISIRGIRSYWQALDIPQTTVLLYGPVSVACLFYLDITSNSGMTTRLLLPTVPFFLVTVGSIVQQLMGIEGRSRHLVSLAVVLLLASFVAGQRISLAEFHDDAMVGRAVYRTLQQEVTDEDTLLSVLQRTVTADTALLSCQPQLASLFIKRPVLGLPTSYFNKSGTGWTADTTRQYMDAFPVRYVLLMVGSEITNDAQFFQELQLGQIPTWLRPIASGEGYCLFEVIAQ